jgi:hypothetical protein
VTFSCKPASVTADAGGELAAGAVDPAALLDWGAPQLGQNPALSATAAPHFVQCGMDASPGRTAIVGGA